MRRVVCYMLLLMLFAGCSASRSPKPSEQFAAVPIDKGQTWQLVEFRGKQWQRQGGATTLVLNPEAGTCRGFAACNTYFGTYTAKLVSSSAEGDRYELKVDVEGSGSLGCPDAEMNAEGRYLALLEKADAMLVTAYSLTLCQRGREVMVFELQ